MMRTKLRSATALAVTAMFALRACDGGTGNSSPSPKPVSQPPAQIGTTRAGSADPTGQTPPDAQPVEQKDVRFRLAVDGEGLRLFNSTSGSALPIAFGRPQREVMKALQQVRGAATTGKNADCGAGPVDYATWPDGLSVLFQRGRFVGWGIDRRAKGSVTTASGVGPGSTRAQLDDTYADVSVRQSSLGTEFAAGGFSGVIDGSKASSRITDMWAGTSCVAR